ncbi:hypothetical protein [Streptomyces sp. H27-D2]|uniref:hypothetical protein n=1 Tax=Streptomyces sp. H27-D2 TaxID=3046304 RepID=UPI002DBED7EB|nr:hypothetical protein [Streptomyces sp. H27-D2]MEC4018812.1 hypothetical protein [Streptomyces sp. H27-D2]
MTFRVYPDPPTTPLKINPGATEAVSIIQQLTGEAVPPGSYPRMMFFRVAMVGGLTPPTLFLQAGNGTPVEIITFTTGVFVQVAGQPDRYVGDVVRINETDNVIQIRMGFDQAAGPDETWHLLIKNNDPAKAREFTWVVAQTIAETAQPWIDITPAQLPYHPLVNESLTESVQVANKGTGALNITGVGPALPTGFVVSTPLPLTVPPSGTSPLAVTFTAPAAPPAPDGRTLATTSLTASPADTTAGTGAGHSGQLSLVATTQRLEVVLLLDSSGSMDWDPLGNTLPPGATTRRWDELVSANSQFLNLLALFGQGIGRFGIARFPAGDPQNPASFDIVPMTAIPNEAGMAAAKAAVKAIQPAGGTPMGDGLDHVLAPATSFFGTDQLSVSADRRWLILMSDGAHNSGTHNPLEFIAPPAGTAPAGTSLAQRNIALFAVAYGIDGHTDVNHPLMTQLAAGSLDGGNKRYVDDEKITGQDLAVILRDALKSGLAPVSSPLDRQSVFVIGDDEVRHEAVITPYDSKAAFTLSWNTPDSDRLRLELLTPNCELITPENAGQGRFEQVTFIGEDRSQMYLINPDFLRAPASNGKAGVESGTGGGNGDGGGRARHGTWKFVITGPDGGIILGADEPDAENYAYDVLVDSTLRMEVGLDHDTYFAGDPVNVTARLTIGGRPVAGAAVSLSTTAPDQSADNQLAALRVPEEALKRAREILAGKDASELLIKQLGAQLAGLDIDSSRSRTALQMSDPDGTGVYRTAFTDTSTPEHYTFYVTATGVTDDGAPFHREGKQETFVLVRPEPEHTQLDLRQSEPGVIDVTVIPRDRFGNVLLVDPATTGGFGLTALGGRPGGLTSALDGTYTGSVTFDPKVNPAIGFQFGGREVLVPKPVPPIADLQYVNRVIRFDAGAIKSANQHADPQAALGSVVGKPATKFLSLGALGALVAAIDHRVILAGGNDADVTVFVRPDTDLRSYRVEAYSVDHRKWVPLGESTGITQSFGLRRAKLKFAIALRITDTSGRTRGDDLKPLTTPGVSVRGIGAARTTKDLPCNRDQLPDWFPWPR